MALAMFKYQASHIGRVVRVSCMESWRGTDTTATQEVQMLDVVFSSRQRLGRRKGEGRLGTYVITLTRRFKSFHGTCTSEHVRRFPCVHVITITIPTHTQVVIIRAALHNLAHIPLDILIAAGGGLVCIQQVNPRGVLTPVRSMGMIKIKSTQGYYSVGQQRLVDMVNVSVSNTHGRGRAIRLPIVPHPIPEVDACVIRGGRML